MRRAPLLSLVLVVACSGPRAATTPVAPAAPTPVVTAPMSVAAPVAVVAPVAVGASVADPALAPVAPAVIAQAKAALLAAHGAAHQARIERGVDQVAALWRAGDGDLVAFVTTQFAADQAAQDALFGRLEATIEQVNGHFLELGRTVRWAVEVESGPILPVDRLLSAYDASAHVIDDLFTTKVAFAALLNFPLTTLADRLRDARGYTRRGWAEVRLTGKFDARVPGELEAAASGAEVAADAYIAGYNVWMHHVVGPGGGRLFPAGKRLISHWNLRDELKANYAAKDGLPKQRLIAAVMERIVTLCASHRAGPRSKRVAGLSVGTRPQPSISTST